MHECRYIPWSASRTTSGLCSSTWRSASPPPRSPRSFARKVAAQGPWRPRLPAAALCCQRCAFSSAVTFGSSALAMCGKCDVWGCVLLALVNVGQCRSVCWSNSMRSWQAWSAPGLSSPAASIHMASQTRPVVLVCVGVQLYAGALVSALVRADR